MAGWRTAWPANNLNYTGTSKAEREHTMAVLRARRDGTDHLLYTGKAGYMSECNMLKLALYSVFQRMLESAVTGCHGHACQYRPRPIMLPGPSYFLSNLD